MPLTTSTELLKSRPICPVERDLETLETHKVFVKFINSLVIINFSECPKFFVHFDLEKVTKIIHLVMMDKILATRYGLKINWDAPSRWIFGPNSAWGRIRRTPLYETIAVFSIIKYDSYNRTHAH